MGGYLLIAGDDEFTQSPKRTARIRDSVFTKTARKRIPDDATIMARWKELEAARC